MLEQIRADILTRDSIRPEGTPVTIFFPASDRPWYLRRPFLADRSNLEIRGAGQNNTVVEGVYQYNQGMTLVFGVSRRPLGLSLPEDSWVDLYGKMDPRAVDGPNRRWGLRLRPGTHVSCTGTPLSGAMRHWRDLRQTTIEFAVTGPSGAPLPDGYLFGMGADNTGPMPLIIDVAWGGWFRVTFRTTNGEPEFTGDLHDWDLGRRFLFRSESPSELRKVSVQIDLVNAKFQAYVNGVQVQAFADYGTGWGGTPFRAEDKLQFIPNEFAPFTINSRSLHGYDAHVPEQADRTFCGLLIAQGLRYKNLGAGAPQARFDGRDLNDRDRFFESLEADVVACLDLTDGPPSSGHGPLDGRLVTVSAGGAAGQGNVKHHGLFLHSNTQGGGTNWLGSNILRDITVRVGASGTARTFGQAVALGAVLRMTIENVNANGGFYGIGSLNFGAAYPISLRGVCATGDDAGYYGSSQLVSIESFVGGYPGTTGIRLLNCSMSARHVYFNGTDCRTESLVRTHAWTGYGGNFQIENLFSDGEGSGFPSEAIIHCENHDLCPTSLLVRNVSYGTLGDKAVVILLRDMNRNNDEVNGRARAGFELDGLTGFGTNHRAHVLTDGSLWSGDVRHTSIYVPQQVRDLTPVVENRGPDGQGRVVNHDDQHIGPPRVGSWWAGSNLLYVRNPAEGQYAELRCLKTGTYGTPQPPLWAGIAPLSLSEDAQAAYCIDHIFMTALLN